VRQLNGQIVGIDHRALSRLAHQPIRMVGDELIGGRYRQNQDGVREFATTSGAAHLLPKTGARARKTALHNHLQLPDVDAQLQGVGGDDTQQFTLYQIAFDLAPFDGRVSAAVTGQQV
jgi:hypothetical protein